MKNAAEPSLLYHPKDACFDAPDAKLISAYIDLNCGTLTAGPLESKKTKFVRKNGVPTTSWKQRPPMWTVLHLPITAPEAVIQLVPYDNSAPTTIKVKTGGSVLIGNARETDIIGSNYPAENPRENFKLYYLLSSQTMPSDPGLPATEGVPINACSNTNWP